MIYETDVKEFEGLRCKVQTRRCLDGSFQQRHVWYAINGTVYDPPSVDPWIASFTRKPEIALRGMRPSADRDELDELIEALREIAAGHNDARARAEAALKAAGLI